jgi:hypothetical protein
VSAAPGSLWQCTLCHIYLVIEGQPRRRKCRWCNHWMSRKDWDRSDRFVWREDDLIWEDPEEDRA